VSVMENYCTIYFDPIHDGFDAAETGSVRH